jgi:signal transduction histidine kinase
MKKLYRGQKLMTETPLEPHDSGKALDQPNLAASSGVHEVNMDADHLAAALTQVQQLNAELEQRNRQLTALYEIGRMLSATLNVRELYRVIFQEITQKLLGAPHLMIALYEAETETLSCGFAIVDNEELDPAQLPPLKLGKGPVSDTIRTRQPRIVDLQAEYFGQNANGQAKLIGEGPIAKSALYVPMISNNRVIGVMQIQHYATAAFQETDLTLLSILANQAAIAFENAQLYAQVQRHAQQLEQRVAERTRELAEANDQLTELDRLKDQFVSSVSHELRTPLANVKLYLQLLTRGRPDKHDDYLQTLYRETRRLEKLIDDLLDLSRLDLNATVFYVEPTDINYLVAELAQDRIAMAADRGLIIDCQLAPDLLPALVDPQRFTQVMSNLTTNAMNYTSAGGLITLSTARQQHAGDAWITFSVRDTGCGIPARELPHIFERFFRGAASHQSNTPGTGLGLAICREIVEHMGGAITVESEIGQGATFTVWLRPAD